MAPPPDGTFGRTARSTTTPRHRAHRRDQATVGTRPVELASRVVRGIRNWWARGSSLTDVALGFAITTAVNSVMLVVGNRGERAFGTVRR